MKEEAWNQLYDEVMEDIPHHMRRPELYALVDGVRAKDIGSCLEVLHIGPDRFVNMCVAFNKSIGEGHAIVTKARTTLREAGYEYDRAQERWYKA